MSETRVQGMRWLYACRAHPAQENAYYSMDPPVGWHCNVCGKRCSPTLVEPVSPTPTGQTNGE